MTAWFDFYELLVEVRSESAALITAVQRDFAFFATEPSTAAVVIDVHRTPPVYTDLPAVPATVVTPRNVCFRNGRTTYIDYFGRALVVFNRASQHCTVQGTDPDLLREIVYLFVLSTVGQHLDGRGLHRIHALGVSYRDRGYVLLLPSGGGKSTMALDLFREPGFSLLSEDTPLVDRTGRLLPFHLPLGLRPECRSDVPQQYVRTVRRMEFDPKMLVDLAYFEDYISTQPVEACAVLVGQRNLGDQAEIVPISRLEAFRALVKYMIVGLGIFQGLEFLLERGLWDSLGRTGTGFSRLWNALRLLSKARVYRFVLGRDHDANRKAFLEFVRQKI